jgi:hypothetical protein
MRRWPDPRLRASISVRRGDIFSEGLSSHRFQKVPWIGLLYSVLCSSNIEIGGFVGPRGDKESPPSLIELSFSQKSCHYPIV